MSANAISIDEFSCSSHYIEMGYNELSISSGTSFFWRDAKEGAFLVTNWHNVSGRRPDTFQPLSPKGAIPNVVHIWMHVKGKLGSYERVSIREPRWLEHPTYRSNVDVVAIKLEAIPDIVEIMPINEMKQQGKMNFSIADDVFILSHLA